MSGGASSDKCLARVWSPTTPRLVRAFGVGYDESKGLCFLMNNNVLVLNGGVAVRGTIPITNIYNIMHFWEHIYIASQSGATCDLGRGGEGYSMDVPDWINIGGVFIILPGFVDSENHGEADTFLLYVLAETRDISSPWQTFKVLRLSCMEVGPMATGRLEDSIRERFTLRRYWPTDVGWRPPPARQRGVYEILS